MTLCEGEKEVINKHNNDGEDVVWFEERYKKVLTAKEIELFTIGKLLINCYITKFVYMNDEFRK